MQVENEMTKAEFDKEQKRLKRERWEIMFMYQLEQEKYTYVREFKFHPKRKWRFDFVINVLFATSPNPENWIAVEIEGGTYSRGRHTRGVGFAKDCEKHNTAASMGWRVLRFPSEQVKDGSAIKFLMENTFT